MTRPVAGLTAGLIAGAAGVTALNTTSYLHQVVYGKAPRPSDTSGTPAATAKRVAGAVGVDIPGSRGTRRTRLAALGPLGGIGVGVAVAAVAGVLRGGSVKVPRPAAAAVVGLTAMAISDGIAAATGATEPGKWTPAGIAADALPHLAYGAVTTWALHRLLDPRSPDVA